MQTIFQLLPTSRLSPSKDHSQGGLRAQLLPTTVRAGLNRNPHCFIVTSALTRSVLVQRGIRNIEEPSGRHTTLLAHAKLFLAYAVVIPSCLEPRMTRLRLSITILNTSFSLFLSSIAKYRLRRTRVPEGRYEAICWSFGQA